MCSGTGAAAAGPRANAMKALTLKAPIIKAEAFVAGGAQATGRGGMAARWLLINAFILIALAFGTAPQAQANSKYASIVIDSETGEVFYARNADSYRYPASLTKMMTLYLLFEALEDGKVSLSTKMKVSKYADSQPASDLGVAAGSTISVEDAILALIIRSANDVAVVVAEHLGGSERNFAKMMTEKARELGMTKTTFRNPHGLPDRAQRTTARDMAILSLHVKSDFPQYYDYFSETSFSYNGRRWRTHNNLVKYGYDGTTGIKTGYTRASGFNLSAAVDRNGYNLIGIVMGGRTSKRRDRDMQRILELTFRRLIDGFYGQREIRLAVLPRPKPWSPAAALYQRPLPEEEDAPSRDQGLAVAELPVTPQRNPMQVAQLRRQQNEDSIRLAELTLRNRQAEAEAQGDGPGENDQLADLIAVASLAPDIGWREKPQPLPADRQKKWGIQIGAFLELRTADHHIDSAVAVAPDLLQRPLAAIMPLRSEGDLLYRVRFGPMDQQTAVDACAALKSRSMTCFTMPEANWLEAMRR